MKTKACVRQSDHSPTPTSQHSRRAALAHPPNHGALALAHKPGIEEKDSCALFAAVRKDGKPAHELIERAIGALEQMLHRAGTVDGEGDGCGLLLDIPRQLWAEEVRRGGHASHLALDPAFAVGHVFVPRSERKKVRQMTHDAHEILNRAGLRILAEREGMTDSTALGPTAREEEPIFWQVAGLAPAKEAGARDRVLFELGVELENELGVHVASFSADSCVYKVMGGPRVIPMYYPDLREPSVATTAVFGHNRYSTNTWPSFARVQPFSMLGHNGEINTIEKLREEARMLGVPIVPGCSDSQDLNRTIETLVKRQGLSLVEAIELVLPPIVDEIEALPDHLRSYYMYLREAFGPFAQGPVALMSRHGNESVFSSDALGLRPFWRIETADAHVFSSEPGVVAIADMVSDPQPLAPGEKVMTATDPEKGTRLIDHGGLQELARKRLLDRAGAGELPDYGRALDVGGPAEGPEIPGYESAGPSEPVKVPDDILAGFGWLREDVKLVQQMASNGAEPIGSLGYDGPLAALSPERQNLTDYFKETVAVVTNPAIDREREVEHFDLRSVFGRRPSLADPAAVPGTVETSIPVILGGHHGLAPLSDTAYRAIARNHGTYLLEDLWEEFPGKRSAVLDITCLESEDTVGAIERLKHEAATVVRDGAELVVLSDRTAFEGERRYLDPHLCVSAIDLALKEAWVEPGEGNLRRRTSLVLRSGAVRNLHDIALAVGLGADGVCPYVMVEVICVDDYQTDVENLVTSLFKGLEKVISTIGIHELRGYARLFSSIGLKPEIAELLGTANWCASEDAGFGFAELDADGDQRQRILMGAEGAKPAKTFHFYPKVYKAAIAAANGTSSYDEYSEKVQALEREQAVAMRHALDLRRADERAPLDPAGVDPGVGHHDYPVVISSMSFGSQSEIAFRAYAEAAKQINIVCMNGEGGEIRDMIGRYPKWRGQQIASGRFGVSSDMINSSYLVEIKIGQGAKPGEGGHLPAKKVTEKVAAARNATTGTDLISPSNNHDLYSIEDLAELIDELKTANPDVRVSVKVPVVPNIGTIGVGIAKAGADIITLSGFEGGTGAARTHALRHVGLPSDIGTRAVHLALLEAGIRSRVEIWADGGLRTGLDIVKMHCLGANRVGFGTLAMVSIGCTICRGCQLDTCHVGIATQIETKEEADFKGLKKFTPQQYGAAVEACARFFTGMGEEVRRVTAELGFERSQDLVGRADLLVQARARETLDLRELIEQGAEFFEIEPAELAAEEERAEAGLILARPIRMERKQASAEVAAYAADVCSGKRVSAEYPRPTNANDRVLGTELAGEIARARIFGEGPEATDETLAAVEFNRGSVAGSGFGAFNVYGVDLRVVGGAQDGVGKTALGGTISVMKGRNSAGKPVNGSVGKSFAYGAQRGRFFVQGNADSRFCIRLSGADVVIGGEPAGPLADDRGHIADRANIKGFGFEYMTAGRAVVLGDPGPWLCAGQTGGRVYLRVNEEWGLDRAALERRLGDGSKVSLEELDDEGVLDVQELIGNYADELRATDQDGEAERVLELADAATANFVMSVPLREQTDPSISTE